MRTEYIPIESLEEATAERLNQIYETYSAVLNNLDQDNFSSTCRIPVSKILGALSADGGTLTGPITLSAGATIDNIVPHELKNEMEAYANTSQLFTVTRFTLAAQVTTDGINFVVNGQDEGASVSISAPDGYDGTNSFVSLNLIGIGEGMPYTTDYFQMNAPLKSFDKIMLTGYASYGENTAFSFIYDVEIKWFRYGL